MSHVNSEFILGQSRLNVSMSMCTNIWVDSQTGIYNFIFSFCDFIYHFKFRYAFYIKTVYIFVNTQFDFPIGFSNSGKYCFVWIESGIERNLYFTTADTVNTQ